MIKTIFRYVQIKTTPNPLCLKFLPEKPVMKEGTCDFASVNYATMSPLAKSLFDIEGVNRVFYGPDYISVTKAEFSSWEYIQPSIVELIKKHFGENIPLFVEEVFQKSNYDEESEIESIIKEILEGRVRPYVHEDGGDIKFIEFNKDTGIVTLEMQGSCAGCPSSFATLKEGIEKMLMFYLPEVKGVQSVN
jgi:NFU1 iron-sulfur cluster scaffold homolog, mitochondrial